MTSKRTTRSKAHSGQSDFGFLKQAEDYKPHGYQRRAIRWLIEHAAGALFLDPGLGKTSATFAALKILRERGLVSKALVLAPLRVCHSVWPGEREKWTDFHGLRLVVLHGPNKDELLKADADVFVCNYDGLAWLLDIEVFTTTTGKRRPKPIDMKRWKALGFDLLVMDELSKLKHTSSVRFKALKQVIRTFGRRWGLTGSPAPNGLIDLFGQCYMVDEGRSLGRYVSHYRSQFFDPLGPAAGSELGKAPKVAYGWKLREGAAEQIYKRVKPLALRMAAEDYLEMPELVENVVRVELPPKAKRLHDELEEELIASIDDRTIVATNAAAASTKCRQVANGAVYLDPGLRKRLGVKEKREWVEVHSEKTTALRDLVDELQGEPLLVAYDFEHDLARLQKEFPGAPHIGGGVSTQKAKGIEAAWNAGDVPILLGHPQSLAHGLNLQGAGRNVAWHSLTWNYELYDQFVRRVLRQGNKHKQVFVHLLVGRDTIDEAILRALRAKERGQRALFDALRSRRRPKR